jgi:hypothetical protein
VIAQSNRDAEDAMTIRPVTGTIGFAAVASVLALTSMASPAAAAIKCKNGFQLVQGNYIATPYCQDALLTRVAREYGMRVSGSEIRWNPNYKRQVCRTVGHDIRVQENCRTVNPSVRGRSF